MEELEVICLNRKILIVIALLAILGGVAVVAAVVTIYSPVTTGPTVAPVALGPVTWTDASVFNPPSVSVGDSLTLNSTVTGTMAGGVIFYYSTSPFTEPANGVAGLTEIGVATVTNGVATYAGWAVPLTASGGQLYFVAVGLH